MNKVYTRINWENEPSFNTPINEENLNAMDVAINELDNRVVEHDTSKANATELSRMVVDWVVDEETGVVTVTQYNGNVTVFNLNTTTGGGGVTGVKGEAETDYRKGLVNITAENVGAASVDDVEQLQSTVEELEELVINGLEITKISGIQYLLDYGTTENYYYNENVEKYYAVGYRIYPSFKLQSGKYYISGDVSLIFSHVVYSDGKHSTLESLAYSENGFNTFSISEEVDVYITNIRNKAISDETGEIVFIPPMICNNIPPKEYVEGEYFVYVINDEENEDNEDNNSYTTKTITVGPGESFEDIKSALDSIVDNSKSIRYVVYVKNGTYSVPSSLNYFGLKNYVSIIGESKESVIVQNLYSDTVYDAERSVFDPYYYTEAIEYASVKNMTIISKGCKCPIHIDTDYEHFADGGIIEIDNCILTDKNTLDMTNLPIRTNHYNAGSINVGLSGGQCVKVSNVISNGMIYAHNRTTQTKPCRFEVEHCAFLATMWGDLGSNQEDVAVFSDCTFQQFYYTSSKDITSTKVRTELYNNNIDTVTSIGTEEEWNDSFYEWNRLHDGKFTTIEQNIHKQVYNVSNKKIIAGSLVQLVSMRSDSEQEGIQVEPYSQGYLYGYAMENIASGKSGFIQFKNVVEIPYIDGISVGDEIEYVDGTFRKKTNYKTVGYYMGTAPYNRNLMKLAVEKENISILSTFAECTASTNSTDVAGASALAELAEKCLSKFAVVSGTTSNSASQISETIPFPTGFTNDNCILVGYSIFNSVDWRCGSNLATTGDRIFAIKNDSGISFFTSSENYLTKPYKVTLMRTDI